MDAVVPYAINPAKTKVNKTRLTKPTKLTCAVFPAWLTI
jgi:hypothetical protein